jgi:NAD(P)-dependent dehydrogenase (short-subunit alcohol dehydrogenase family)
MRQKTGLSPNRSSVSQRRAEVTRLVKGSRVVVTLSIAHKNAKIDWDDLNAEKGYDRMKRYSASKLANALFFFELDRRLRASGSPVTAVGSHPGSAATDLGRYLGPLQILLPLVKVFLNTAAMGAWPTLQAATGDVTPGEYYGPTGLAGIRGVSGEVSRAPQAQDSALAQRLWDVSVAMTGITPALPPADRQTTQLHASEAHK